MGKLKSYSAVLFDLDNTLVLTDELKEYRSTRNWNRAISNLQKTYAPDGTRKLLRKIRKTYGMKLGVVTRSPRQYAKALLQKHELDVDSIVAHGEARLGKPHPDGIYLAANQLDVPREECIYIGDPDDAMDRRMAQRASVSYLEIDWKIPGASWSLVENVLEVLPKKTSALSRLSDSDKTNRFKGLIEENTTYLFDYKSGRNRDSVGNLVLSFKEFDPHVVDYVSQLSVELIQKNEVKFRTDFGITKVMAIPRSNAKNPNYPCEQLSENIASEIPWITHIRQGILRNRTVAKSARAQPRERLSVDEHLDSLIMGLDSSLFTGGSVMLIDDVITQGVQFQACKKLLKQAGFGANSYGFFVAKTLKNL